MLAKFNYQMQSEFEIYNASLEPNERRMKCFHKLPPEDINMKISRFTEKVLKAHSQDWSEHTCGLSDEILPKATKAMKENIIEQAKTFVDEKKDQ